MTAGETHRQRDRRPGHGEHQPEAKPGHPELLHQRFQQEPFGGEPRGQRQPGQRQRADGQPGPAPRQPPRRAAQPIQVVAVRARAVRGDDRAGGVQQRLGGRVRDDLQRGGEQPGRDQRTSRVAAPVRATPYPARMSPLFSTLEYAITRCSRGCTAACAIPSSAVSPASTSSSPTSQRGRRAEQGERAPQAVEADVDRDARHDRPDRAGRGGVPAGHPHLDRD